jgi:hypothetical protein
MNFFDRVRSIFGVAVEEEKEKEVATEVVSGEVATEVVSGEVAVGKGGQNSGTPNYTDINKNKKRK